MKRITFLLLAGMLLLGGLLFAGGQQGSGRGARRTLVVDSRLWSVPAEQEYVINNVFKQFEKENNCLIDFSIVTDPKMLERAKVQKETNHITTDVVIVYVAEFPNWVNNDYIIDLSPYVKSWEDRTFSKGFNTLTIFDGKQYFCPIGADVYLTCANEKALQYLPSGADVQALSWEQLIDWALAIAEGEGEGKFAWTGVPQKMLIYQFGSMVLSYGGGFPDLNSPAALKAWDQFVRLQKAFSPAVKTYDNVVPAMKRGEIWLTVTHNARVGQIYESNPTQFVIAPAPSGPKGIGSIAGTSGLAVVKGSANEDLAIKFIEYITRPKIMLDVMKGTGGFIPPIDECVDLIGTGVKDEVIAKALTVLDKGVLSFVPGYLYQDWGAVKLVYDNAFYELVLERGAVNRSYLDRAAKEITALEK